MIVYVLFVLWCMVFGYVAYVCIFTLFWLLLLSPLFARRRVSRDGVVLLLLCCVL